MTWKKERKNERRGKRIFGSLALLQRQANVRVKIIKSTHNNNIDHMCIVMEFSVVYRMCTVCAFVIDVHVCACLSMQWLKDHFLHICIIVGTCGLEYMLLLGALFLFLSIFGTNRPFFICLISEILICFEKCSSQVMFLFAFWYDFFELRDRKRLPHFNVTKHYTFCISYFPYRFNFD